MNNQETAGNVSKVGFPLCSVTFLVLLIVKLFNVAEIAWVWVFAPLWIPVALFIAFLVVLFIGSLIVAFFESLRK